MLLTKYSTKYDINGNKKRYAILTDRDMVLGIYFYDYDILNKYDFYSRDIEVSEQIVTFKEYNIVKKSNLVKWISLQEEILEDINKY